ncbi:MAG TPA: signal peptidase I [Anaerolineaceae bacterium]|nr:signal peptidase I [Anaerolineaceae bacterium]
MEQNEIETNLVEPTPQLAPEKKARGFWRDLIETILMAVVLFLVLNAVTSRVRVYNISMQPTLYEGNLLVVNKIAYKLGEPKRGDIIVFHYQGAVTEDYIKRVIGLPGDTINVASGVVKVNGQAITEPYIAELPGYTGTWTVPDGELFVLGDNRNHSSDSHDWGFVQKEWVVGKAIVVYWPLDRIRVLLSPDLVHAAP